MKRVFSGVQPSGELTLGNYLGALRNFVRLQHEAECFFCVVDLHAITVPQDPAQLNRRTFDLAKLYVASGLDPKIATIFVQSHVPAHSELSWLLSCFTYIGELSRMTQFKEKGRKGENVSSGLLMYPVLMAADILLYDTDAVPVGEDQKQHLELSRNIAERINHHFGPVFRVPEPLIPPKKAGARIMSLTDPTAKMAKSGEANSYIALLDPPEVIAKKIRAAVTDSGREVYYDEVNKPAISNLMVIYSLCSGEALETIAERYGSSGYGRFKSDLAEHVIQTLKPIQERYRELSEPGVIEAILAEGAAKAESVAKVTLDRFRQKIGLVPRFNLD
ncbi:MAG TPA: tryptophan--tRNA ligase [Firmicutes bacterium]|nr:tryptophan--tRNA ligase [Bacillota bacterium]